MKTPFKNAAKPFKNAPSASRAQGDVFRAEGYKGRFRASLDGVVFAACSAATVEGEASWFQTTPPYGEYSADGTITGKDGKPIKGAKIVFDEKSVARVVEAFKAKLAAADFPGVLVDREHFSLDLDKPSDAMAWARDIRVADDGSIWTRWEFTPTGRELYETKTLINRSPVLKIESRGSKVFAPFELESIGMTNTPHFKDLSPLAAARENNTKGETTMDADILTALGLAAEASKEDVLAAIKALKDGMTAANTEAETEKKRADDAEAACRGLKADAFIAANKDRITDAAKFREAYLKAPEATEQAFALCKGATAPAPTTRIVTRDAKTPTGSPAEGDATAKIAARNKAVTDYRAAHKCDFNTAWSACRTMNPGLFND